MARPDVSEERRKQIVDTAALVFARHGFHRARVDDIVKESGLSKGTIYWYFNSKEEIIFALLDRFFVAKMERLHTLIDEGYSASECLFTFVRLALDQLHEADQAGLVPLFYEFYALSTRSEPVRQFLLDKIESARELFVPLIQRGIDQGEFRPVDPENVLITIWALIEGLIVLWCIKPTVPDRKQQTFRSLQLLLDGIKAT